jgi:cbb3-type cytochrome oxidase subunit 3
MTSTRRSFMWPTIIIAVGCIWLLMTAGAFPEAVGDILVRAWPALLIIFGFDVLVGRRRLRVSGLTIDMNFLGLIATILLLVAVVFFAYQKHASDVRDEQVKTFAQTLTDDISKVQIEVSLNMMDVSVIPSAENSRDLRAEFKGSSESDVTMNWAIVGNTAKLTITEKTPDPVPKLENYGEGTLEMMLPSDVPVEVFSLVTNRGDIGFNMQPLRIDSLNLTTGKGDVTLNLPTSTTLGGSVINRDGSIELTVPENVTINLNLARGSGRPTYRYDTRRYDVLQDLTLKHNNTAGAFQVILNISTKDGAPVIVTDLG